MSELTNFQRTELRRQANQMKPLVQIGKNGLTDGVVASLDQALENHELVKVKFLDFQDEKKTLTAEMVDTTRSILISLVGNIATLYRQQPDPDKRKIDL
jgi:RNA-binding protein